MARVYLRSPAEVAADIGARARRVRKQAGITQAELAERAGIGRRTLQRFEESGTTSVEALVRIAFALGLPDTFDQLFRAPGPRTIDEVLAGDLEDPR